MKTTHAVWERENLGVDAYEIALDASDTPDLLRQEEARIIAAGAEYIVVKTPVDCPALLFSMQALGYTFVETVFHVMIRRDEYHMPASIARFDRGLRVVERREEADRERIYALIRRGVFKSDRVSIDPAFGRAKGGNRYANWLRSMLARGGFLYEVLSATSPSAFSSSAARMKPRSIPCSWACTTRRATAAWARCFTKRRWIPASPTTASA